MINYKPYKLCFYDANGSKVVFLTFNSLPVIKRFIPIIKSVFLRTSILAFGSQILSQPTIITIRLLIPLSEFLYLHLTLTLQCLIMRVRLEGHSFSSFLYAKTDSLNIML